MEVKYMYAMLNKSPRDDVIAVQYTITLHKYDTAHVNRSQGKWFIGKHLHIIIGLSTRLVPLAASEKYNKQDKSLHCYRYFKS